MKSQLGGIHHEFSYWTKIQKLEDTTIQNIQNGSVWSLKNQNLTMLRSHTKKRDFHDLSKTLNSMFSIHFQDNNFLEIFVKIMVTSHTSPNSFLWFYNLSPPFPSCCLSLRYRDCFVDVFIRDKLEGIWYPCVCELDSILASSMGQKRNICSNLKKSMMIRNIFFSKVY